MGGLDWVAYATSCAMASLAIVAELRDMQVCGIAMARARPEVSPWKYVLTVIMYFRRYSCMTIIAVCIPFVVMYRGADSLSICFNTLAIMVCLQLERDVYNIALPEETKLDFEENGGIDIGISEKRC